MAIVMLGVMGGVGRILFLNADNECLCIFSVSDFRILQNSTKESGQEAFATSSRSLQSVDRSLQSGWRMAVMYGLLKADVQRCNLAFGVRVGLALSCFFDDFVS